MLFNSVEYFLFLPVVAGLYFALPFRTRWVLLLAASYFFYMRWNASYAALIAGSTAIDYLVGLNMERAETPSRKKVLLLISLVANLGLLFVFKYWGFFNDTARWLADALGVHWEVPDLDVLLPVGISFYTFQTLSYTIDIYRGRLKAERHFGRFALFVALFPQLVAGPIERASHLLPQLRKPTSFDAHRIGSGLMLILWGLFKKVVIADRLGIYVDAVYENAEEHSATTHLVATYAFAWQIFCDFSGYSDIAIGSARILGYDLMENFRQPYLAENIREFWRRWHISLSTWLRDYLYISLGGSRKGEVRTYANLMITMLLGGLWHGASWNFVIWGGLQGFMLALNRLTEPLQHRIYRALPLPERGIYAVRVIVTFHLVCLSWVFFRAQTFDAAALILDGWFSLDWGSLFDKDRMTLVYGFSGVLVLLIAQIAQNRGVQWQRYLREKPLAVRWAVFYAGILAILLFGVDEGAQFIYFQF